jgi:sec-independent protein translocase protein TatA
MIKPGPLEIGLILVIILIVFGVGKLPQVGAALGKSINAFKKGTKGEDEEAQAAEAKTKKKAKKKPAKKKESQKAGSESEGEAKPAAEETKPASAETPAEKA